MRKVEISYMTAPLPEYIGSQIYKVLGYKVHETKLGIRNGKLVLACKDFAKPDLQLQEFREIKNYYNQYKNHNTSIYLFFHLFAVAI